MEIRTCEEYVISELFDAKNEVDRLQQALAEQKEAHQETVNRLDEIMKSFQELRDLLVEISSVHETETYRYLGFNSVYSNWDKDNYDKLVALVPELLAPRE